MSTPLESRLLSDLDPYTMNVANYESAARRQRRESPVAVRDLHPPAVQCVGMVVHDNDCLRQLTHLFQSVSIPTVHFPTAQNLLSSSSASQVSCFVIDMHLPDGSGLALMIDARQRGMMQPVIVISGDAECSIAVQTIKSGALDFLVKPLQEFRVLERVHDAFRRDAVYRKHRAYQLDVHDRLTRLSSREREVLELLLMGYLNKQIAAQMGVSERTIETHRMRGIHKMGAQNLVHLTRMVMQACQLGIPDTPWMTQSLNWHDSDEPGSVINRLMARAMEVSSVNRETLAEGELCAGELANHTVSV